jgi:uncharacterized protein CbrC (UPF0167 family)
MPTQVINSFDDIVQAIGNAAAEALLRGESEMTFSSSARDVWVTHVEDAVRRMIAEGRVGDRDVETAAEAAKELIGLAAQHAREDLEPDPILEFGRDEINESDIAIAMQIPRIWPFT